jgi:hypothetical protein
MINRRFWVPTSIIAALLAAGILISICLREIERRRTQKDISQAKALCGQFALGSSRADVERILQGRGIEHSYINATPDSQEYSHTEHAIIRNVCGKNLVTCDVSFVFEFDERELLKSCSAKDIYTGP